ncbi:hypothetical protein EKK58_11795 [Candidatus Dependentiae bacterium]|nr:MAG: hypothetical protein EKK58_11795 [Candidatus Dependentiae bacterium]
MNKLESQYQQHLIQNILSLIPGCLILKNDPTYRQGIPDLTVFYKDKWAFLEVKISATSKEQPNQRYYIDTWSEHVFASFIYPENEKETLDALQRSLQS